MENEEELSLSKLKAVFEAQTEVYTAFQLALQDVLDKQKHLIKEMDALKTLNRDEFRNLDKEHYALVKVFENFENVMTSRQELFETTIEEYTAQISHFGATMDHMKHEIRDLFTRNFNEMDKEIEKIKKTHFDVKMVLNRIVWVIGGIATFLTMVNLFSGKTIAQIVGLK
jgi:predicted RNase H-like nuclease (RuvC/YqgF family)